MALAALSRGELSVRKPWPVLAGIPAIEDVCVSARGCVNAASVQVFSCWPSRHRVRVCGVTTYILQKGPYFLNPCNKDVDVTSALGPCW